MQTYGIGGNEVPTDAHEAFADIPGNRTLLVEKLTDDAPVKPDIVEGLKSIDEVFQHYQPKVKVEFENPDGRPEFEELKFTNLGDFGPKGITNQSVFLQNLTNQRDEYQRIIKQLKSNKVLRNVVSDPEKRQAFLDVIKVMIKELSQTNIK